MKKFKCVLLRSQYQTVVVEAEDYMDNDEIKNKAEALFNYDIPCEEYLEVYDMEEVPTTTTKE
jgi:hypothetical protein